MFAFKNASKTNCQQNTLPQTQPDESQDSLILVVN